jgi:hypothetical protein
MRKAGYLLIAVGFLAGSWSAMLDQAAVDWMWFVPALIVGAGGVALARLGASNEGQAKGRVRSNMENLRDALARIVDTAAELDAEKESITLADLHQRIDERFPADLNIFVEARQTIGHVYGLKAYAEVMNEFAAGERYLNRCWSASVDGYIDEAHEYVGRARDQFTRARDVVGALEGAGTSR